MQPLTHLTGLPYRRIAMPETKFTIPCPICGTLFHKKNGRIYCSDECKEKSRRNSPKRISYQKRYMEENKEELLRKSRESMRIAMTKPCYKEGRKIYAQSPSGMEAIKRANLNLTLKRRKHNAHVNDWINWLRDLTKKRDQHVCDFKKFMKTASNGWVARFYKSIGRPWDNPRLSESVRYKIHYRLDLEFRLSEINRQTWRREILAHRDDGTQNFWLLLKERKTCPYCLTPIIKDNAVADHMDPLKLGGANSQQNLTICCRECNQKKAGKSYSEWVATLPMRRQGPALQWYKRKLGRPVQQAAFCFTFGWIC